MQEKVADERITNYEADLDLEFQPLTEKHQIIKSTLHNSLLSYIKAGKTKPISIQGPYGSGKTQLLYDLFKFAWDNGAIAIYTHLERIIPGNEMGASGYASYIGEILNKEIQNLRNSQSQLMTGKTKDYAIRRICEVKQDSPPVVLLVDELEQKYKLLDTTVKTDDHSPMKESFKRR